MRASVVVVVMGFGCAAGPVRERRADALPAGCAVEVLEGTPPRATMSLGEVNARCTGDAMNDAPGCLRALKDQACALGAPLIWGVSSSQTDDALRMHAFAGRYR